MLYQGNNYRVEELNERILNRNDIYGLPSLEPNFTPRGIQTKYTRFSIIDDFNNPPTTIKINNLPNFMVETTFNPGQRAPVSGYMANIDKETTLKNLNFGLQKGLGQNVYIPSSNSDLYKPTIISRSSIQPFPRINEQYNFDPTPHPNISNFPEVGNNYFFNATRYQLRGIGDN